MELTIIDAVVISVFTICLTIIGIKMYSRRCKHEWEKIDEFPVLNTDPTNTSPNVPIAYIYVMQCKNCGKIIQQKIRN